MRKAPRQYHGNRIADRAAARAARGDAHVVRLSQCMIVKNEEKNIERALTWAKDIAFEQIVVDTGSTDRTVEIAESLGAKVFHFEWINDFAAAKNYAIDKARGNWIAFLDADEYFTQEHTAKIIPMLRKMQRVNNAGLRLEILRCSLENIGDTGDVFSTILQQRIFRNTPSIRYVGAIHEYLSSDQRNVYYSSEIAILHTGYTKDAFLETNKGSRNVEILQEQLRNDPDNVNLKGYLADSLGVVGSEPENIEKAFSLYQEVVDSGGSMNDVVAYSSYSKLISRALREKEYDEAIRLSERAVKILPNRPELHYCLGLALYCIAKYDEAWECFLACENSVGGAVYETTLTEYSLADIYRAMALTAINRNDTEKAFEYLAATIAQNEYQEEMCAALMYALRAMYGEKDSSILDYLSSFYDFNDPRDKLFLAKCAKAAKDNVLMIFFYKSITDVDRAALNAESA